MLPLHFLRARLHGLYVITDEHLGGGHLKLARAALSGGAKIIQLRDKSSSSLQLLQLSREVRNLTKKHGALFFINDRLDIALCCGADGVHLGPDDLPVAAARKVCGPHFLIGASCANVSEAQNAARDGADYISAGAIFSTQTKADAGAPIGLENLRRIVAATMLPTAAIGGIGEANISQVLQTGATMPCVISAIANAGDETAMIEATRRLALFEKRL